MLVEILRRLRGAATVAVGVAAIIFVLLHLSGDPVALLVPADAPPELREVIETMLLGLESFFVSLPPEPLTRSDEHTTSLRHATAEGLAQALEQTVWLEGSFEHRTEDLVMRRLVVEQSRREERPGDDGPVTVEREVKARLLFATTGFPAEIDRETGLLSTEVSTITSDQQRIRENLKSVGDGHDEKQFKAALVQKLRAQEDRLEELASSLRLAQQERQQVQSEIDAAVGGLEFETTIG